MFFELSKKFTILFGLLIIFFSSNTLLFSEGFTANTLVATKDGYFPISQLKEQDQIISYNPEKKAYVIDKILKIQKEKTDKIIQLKVNDSIIEVASNHKFYTDQGWVIAQDLKKRRTELKCLLDKLHIDNVTEVKKDADTYCLSIENNHNFFVTENSVLVHNMFPPAAAVSRFCQWIYPIAKPKIKKLAEEAIKPILKEAAVYTFRKLEVGATIVGSAMLVNRFAQYISGNKSETANITKEELNSLPNIYIFKDGTIYNKLLEKNSNYSHVYDLTNKEKTRKKII